MPILRTFISHTGPDLPELIQPLLLDVAPLGVRPWLDKQDLGALAGTSLTEQLQEGIGTCQAVSLFLSRRSVARRWVQKEIDWARVRPGARVLPVLLEPLKDVWGELPAWVQELFRKHGEEHDLSWLDPARDRDKFIREYAASFYRAAGLDQAEELVLHLGLRAPEWFAEGNVPAALHDLPVLDVRGPAALVGDKNASPTEGEWSILRQRLLLMKSLLPRLRRLHLCGYVPLSLGTVVGSVFDRGLGSLRLTVHNVFQGQEQAWDSALSPAELAEAQAYAPTHPLVSLEAPAELADHRGPVLLCLGKVGFDHYLPAVSKWNAERAEPALPVWVRAPAYLNSPAEARAALLGCYGAMLYVLRSAPHRTTLDVVTTLPWTLMALLSHQLRQVGPVRFYDQVLGSGGYRLALTLP